MALIILPVCITLDDKIGALSCYGDILDNYAEGQVDTPMTQIIITTLLSSAGTITASISDEHINRLVFQAFHKFYFSLTRLLAKASSNPANTLAQFQPLLDEISRRIGSSR